MGIKNTKFYDNKNSLKRFKKISYKVIRKKPRKIEKRNKNIKV